MKLTPDENTALSEACDGLTTAITNFQAVGELAEVGDELLALGTEMDKVRDLIPAPLNSSGGGSGAAGSTVGGAQGFRAAVELMVPEEGAPE